MRINPSFTAPLSARFEPQVISRPASPGAQAVAKENVTAASQLRSREVDSFEAAPSRPLVNLSPGAAASVQPVTSTSGAGRGGLNLEEQLSSPDSLISRAIGYSEGNRSLDGGVRDSYYGHTDPGNQAQNQGTFSYQGAASSPQEADQLWLEQLRAQAPAYEQAAENAGLDPKDPLLAASFFDLYTQSPLAATGEGGFLDRLPELARKGVTPENIIDTRVQSYIDPRTGQLDAPGFGNDPAALRADQARRTSAVNEVIQQEGLAGGQTRTAPPSASSPTRPSAAASTELLANGAEGTAVSQLQSQLEQLGINTGGVDGIFGSQTEAAVRRFQHSQGLEADGLVGPQTRAALAQQLASDAASSGADFSRAIRGGARGVVDSLTPAAQAPAPAADARTTTGYRNGQPYELEVVSAGTNVYGEEEFLRPDAARALKELQAAAAAEGITVELTDAFRSHEEQEALQSQGNAAPPGYSNHQSGISVDLNVVDDRTYQWLLENSQRFGFIHGDSTPGDLDTVPNEEQHFTYRPEFTVS